jgi:hypothetical protein
VVRRAPCIAAIHADGAMPAWLEFSQGMSFQVSGL